MQFGRPLTTRCLDHIRQRAGRSSTGFNTFAQPALDLVLLTTTKPVVQASTYHNSPRTPSPIPSRVFFSTARSLAFSATIRNQKRYRPWRPEFRKIPKDQRSSPPPQQRDEGVECSQEPNVSAPQPKHGDIEFSFKFADAFGIEKGPGHTGCDAVRAGAKPSRKEVPSGDTVKTEQSPKTPARTHLSLSETTTAALEEELLWIARNEPNPTTIKEILTILIQDRKIKPEPQHYEALVLANCDPEEGSAENVKAILRDMEIDGLDIDARIYTAALNVLAIHPSLPLIWSILSTLQTRWMSQTPSMTYALVTIFIRTSQLELANDLLNELHKANKPLPRSQRTLIPKYLYILLIRALVEKKDYEGVIRWLYRLHDRKATEMDMPADFWGWVLENAARDGDGWVTGWLWQDWVEKMTVRPQRDTCIDVLKIAARDGVAWLAESVKDVIRHGGFMEAIDPETVPDEHRIESRPDVSITGTGPSRSPEMAATSEAYRAETSSYRDVGRDENSPSTRSHLRPRQAELKRKGKQNTSAEITNNTDLSHEEESLIDQAYRNSDVNLNKKRGFKALSDLAGQKINGAGEQQTGDVDIDGGEKVRRMQVKPGNLWPWFKNIEGYGNPRFDPWKALGPKSKS